MTRVELEDGQVVNVRRLGLFELDRYEPDPLGPYKYKVEMATGSYLAEYDPYRWDSPPQKPDNENPEEGSSDWYALREYTTYHAALEHEERRQAAMSDYALQVSRHILRECLSESDALKVSTVSDFNLVYNAAINPFVEEGEIAAVLRSSFRSQI